MCNLDRFIKSLDCLNHDLLVAKLEAYGFGKAAFKFIYDYLKDRKQRTKINGYFSSWLERLSRRGAVVKGVEHISIIVLVNI